MACRLVPMLPWAMMAAMTLHGTPLIGSWQTNQPTNKLLTHSQMASRHQRFSQQQTCSRMTPRPRSLCRTALAALQTLMSWQVLAWQQVSSSGQCCMPAARLL